MISLKKFNYQIYRTQFLLLISIFIAGFILYLLVFSPFKNYIEKREKLEVFQTKIKKEKKINQANNQRYSKLSQELKKMREYYNNLDKTSKEKSFKNISSFEKFISEKAKSYNLTIETIGRIERIDKSDKIYIPYIISGNTIDILSFIKELEKSDKKISFTDSNTQISFNPQGKITTKVSSVVLNFRESKTENNSLIQISELSNKKISNIKYLKFNSKIYIIINYKDGSKIIFYEGEELLFNNLKYKIILKNNSPFLKLLKN